MQLGSVRFLVVEDHDVQRRLLAQILVNLGASLIQDAEDGHAALRVMREAPLPIDIMITDVSMPGMDGIELDSPRGRGRQRRQRHPDQRARAQAAGLGGEHGGGLQRQPAGHDEEAAQRRETRPADRAVLRRQDRARSGAGRQHDHRPGGSLRPG
jgi:CheY-like chemotaxis protein